MAKMDCSEEIDTEMSSDEEPTAQGNQNSDYVMIPVRFPQDTKHWPLIRPILKTLQKEVTFKKMVDSLTKLSDIVLTNSCEQKAPHNIFKRLFEYFEEDTHKQDLERFLSIGLPTIAKLASECYEKRPRNCSYILQQQARTIKLGKRFVAGVVASGFLCLWPEDINHEIPIPNFTHFFDALCDIPQSQKAKLRCILNYFCRVANKNDLKGQISFIRTVLRAEEKISLEGLLHCDKPLCPTLVQEKGVIEEAGSSVLQLDFANEYLGGGVLNSGNVQEELRFSMCPELIASMLFMEKMAPNESVLMEGFEQFADTTGYGGSFTYRGNFVDPADRDEHGNILTNLCAIDAIPYYGGYGSGNQYLNTNVNRDINKAYVGFRQQHRKQWCNESLYKPRTQESDFCYLDPTYTRVIATGNWGCGVFGGNPQLKAVLQWLSASYANCPGMIYYTFQQEDMAEFSQIAEWCAKKEMTIGELANVTKQFCDSMQFRGQKTCNLFVKLKEYLCSK